MSKQSWYGGDSESLSIRTAETNRKAWYGGPSASLMITFLLGVAVGFFLCYALLELRQESPAGETVAAPAQAPQTPAAPVETAPAAVDVAAAPANPDDIWPARHLIIGFEGITLDQDTAEMMNRYKPGGVWLRESNTVEASQINDMVKQINGLASIGQQTETKPLIVAAQEGGSNRNVLRVPEALSYEDIARLETLEAIREAGRSTARQALSFGVGVLLSPVLDIFDAEEREAAERSYFLGDTPETVTQAGIAYFEGLQEGGVLAVALHYPGTGSAVYKEDDVALIAETNVEDLASTMMPFLEAAAYDISGMLVSSATVPALDVEVPGRPASLSPVLVREVFRNKWGYSGVLIAEDIHSVSKWSGKPVEKDIVDALAAGCDAVLISTITPEDMARVVEELKLAVTDGRLDSETLSASRQRLDLWRQKLARGAASTTEPGGVVPPVAKEGEGEAAPSPEGEVAPVAEGESKTALEGEGEVQVEPAPEAPPAPKAKEDKKPQVESPPKADVKPEAVPAAAGVQPEGTHKVVHEIKRGDNLSRIANTYGVKVKDIMTWNNITDANIKFGDKLVVYTAQPEAKAAPEVKPAPASETPAPTAEAPVVPESAPAAPAVPEPAPAPPAPVPVPEPPAPAAETPVSEDLPQTTVTAPAIPDTPEEPSENGDTLPAIGDVTPIEPAPEDASESAVSDETGREVKRNFNIRPASEKEADAAAPAAETPEPAPPAQVDSPKPPAEPEMSVTVVPVEGVVVEPPAPVAEATPAPVPAPEPVPAAPAPEYTTHVVGPGDNLSKIAKTYGTTTQELMSLNAITDPNLVKLGTELKVPKP